MPTFSTSHPRFDAVICDIDGCLSPESSLAMDVASLARIAEHNRLAVERRDRPLVTLCSGRPQPFAEAMCRLIGNLTLPLVAENGVWLYDPGTNTYEMDDSITRQHRHAVREAAAWLEDEFGSTRDGRIGVQQQPGKACSISLYHPEPEYLRSICPRIENESEARGWPLRVSMTWFYINCDLKHISKGTGLVRLIRAAGLDPARLAGVGDTMSDLAIREHVGYFACPSNAAPELKERADFVARRPEARGVAEILDNLTAE